MEGGMPLLAMHKYSPTWAREAAGKAREFPSTVDISPPLYRIMAPSSRFHMIFGLGDPWASQVRLTGLPSLTTLSLEVRVSMMEGGTTTSKNPRSALMGSVLTWHMYQPRSDSCTLLICKRHILWSWWDKDMRWFRVMMLWWMVRMVCVSTKYKIQTLGYLINVHCRKFGFVWLVKKDNLMVLNW